MQLESPNLTQTQYTMSPGNPFIFEVKGQGRSFVHYLRAGFHPTLDPIAETF